MHYQYAFGKGPAGLALPLSLSGLKYSGQNSYRQSLILVGVTFHHGEVIVYANFLLESNVLLGCSKQWGFVL